MSFQNFLYVFTYINVHREIQRFVSLWSLFKKTNRVILYLSSFAVVFLINSKILLWGLAQSVERSTLDLRVMSSSPALGIEIT